MNLIIIFNHMYIALREGDGDAVLVQDLVNKFLATVNIADALGHQYILLHGNLYRTVTEIAEADVDAMFGFHHVAALGVFGF